MKECHVKMLNDLHRTSSSVKNYHLKNESYKQIGRKVLSCRNYYLRRTEKILFDFVRCLEFLEDSVGSILIGFFADQGLIEMLEASDFEIMGQVSLILEAVPN